MKSESLRKLHDARTAVLVHERCGLPLEFFHSVVSGDRRLVLVHWWGGFEELDAPCGRFEHCIGIVDLSFVEGIPSQILSGTLRHLRSPRILVLAEGADEQKLEALLLVGCYGFVCEELTESAWKTVIETVNSGELWVSRRVLSRAFQRVASLGGSRSFSRREEDVLQVLGQGCNNKDAAKQLFISHDTLRWHLRNMYTKLGVNSRAELVAHAREHVLNASPDAALCAANAAATVESDCRAIKVSGA
jgi:DNA-binding NarL/FixJ family response regulator